MASVRTSWARYGSEVPRRPGARRRPRRPATWLRGQGPASAQGRHGDLRPASGAARPEWACRAMAIILEATPAQNFLRGAGSERVRVQIAPAPPDGDTLPAWPQRPPAARCASRRNPGSDPPRPRSCRPGRSSVGRRSTSSISAPPRRPRQCAVPPSPQRCSSGRPRGDAIARARPIQVNQVRYLTCVRITLRMSRAVFLAPARRSCSARTEPPPFYSILTGSPRRIVPPRTTATYTPTLTWLCWAAVRRIPGSLERSPCARVVITQRAQGPVIFSRTAVRWRACGRPRYSPQSPSHLRPAAPRCWDETVGPRSGLADTVPQAIESGRGQ